MNTVHVTSTKNYDIHIGSGLLDSLGSIVRKIADSANICILSDSNVFPLYGKTATESLKCCDYNIYSYIIPAGEFSKNGTTYLKILSFLAENNFCRNDIIIALGGGVVGDLAGFVAATYLRGIRLIQVPTTLIAAVDSSVGGKTAIDLPAGKNLAGTFYQPDAVICDIDLLNSLPEDIFRDGCAEIIKYAVLFDTELFEHLRKVGMDFDREYIISKCVEWKKGAVQVDEFDRGRRMLLNLGHTIGHAVEACSNYSISHGKAVAIGIATVARSAYRANICSHKCCSEIISIITQFGLPTITEFPADTLLSKALSDKKRIGQVINLIVPREIGICSIEPIPTDHLLHFIQAGL